jgi:hypothetical protein
MIISPYQGSDEEMRNICSSGNESITASSSFSVGNSDISSMKTKDFLDLAEEKSKSNS